MKQFNHKDWEQVITQEENERVQCDRCKKILTFTKEGEMAYCESCKKFIWREIVKDLKGGVK